jgi:hypothetical protein
MKKWIYLTVMLIFLLPLYSYAEKFLEAPVIPGAKVLQETKSRLEVQSGLSHDKALAFYREQLADQENIKYRDWKDATYIEDDGKEKWHSITISKDDKQGATIVIAKDSWTWIMGTLILRYIGVFVVLLFLFLGMSISGGLISRAVKKMESKKSGG